MYVCVLRIMTIICLIIKNRSNMEIKINNKSYWCGFCSKYIEIIMDSHTDANVCGCLHTYIYDLTQSDEEIWEQNHSRTICIYSVALVSKYNFPIHGNWDSRQKQLIRRDTTTQWAEASFSVRRKVLQNMRGTCQKDTVPTWQSSRWSNQEWRERQNEQEQ